MKAKEFIKTMREDLVTHANKEVLSEVVNVMEEVLEGYAGDIDPQKTAEECYKKMFEVAKRKAKGGSYGMGDAEVRKIVSEYLGITLGEKAPVPQITDTVNLEDFF